MSPLILVLAVIGAFSLGACLTVLLGVVLPVWLDRAVPVRRQAARLNPAWNPDPYHLDLPMGPEIPSARSSRTIPDAAFDPITREVIAEVRRQLKERAP